MSTLTIPAGNVSTNTSEVGRGSDADRGRRGTFRGRGRGRDGRGRGHGYGCSRSNQSSSRPQGGDNDASNCGNGSNNDAGVDGTGSNNKAKENVPKPRLTHFLSLPLGHHAEFRRRISAFTMSLLSSVPAIPGLDDSIVIPARRLHLTLGVMSLSETVPASQTTTGESGSNGSSSDSSGSQSPTRPRTLESAVALLNELRPRILQLLSDTQLRVALQRVDIMKPDRGDPEKAHVMWAGPSHESEDARRLKHVSECIHEEFKRAGLLVDERRPLKLHCTVLNTVYRKPRNKKRVPFSYPSVLASSAFQAIEVKEAVTQDSNSLSGTTSSTVVEAADIVVAKPRGKKPMVVDLGECVIDQVQICEMGSWGPEGEYVCVGHIPLIT